MTRARRGLNVKRADSRVDTEHDVERCLIRLSGFTKKIGFSCKNFHEKQLRFEMLEKR